MNDESNNIVDGNNITSNNVKKEGGCTGKGFVKGDKRCWRKGRPKSFDALRALALEIGREVLTGATGEQMATAELILRQWATSKDFQRQRAFIEVAYGKVPDEMRLSGDNKITIKLKRLGHENNGGVTATAAAPEAEPDLQ